jgi:hypothetical protein
MTTKINVICENGHQGVLEMPQTIDKIMVGGAIIAQNSCPVCSGEMSAPSGEYHRNTDGEMERVGDFVSNTVN